MIALAGAYAPPTVQMHQARWLGLELLEQSAAGELIGVCRLPSAGGSFALHVLVVTTGHMGNIGDSHISGGL